MHPNERIAMTTPAGFGPQLLNRLRMRQVSLLLAIEQHGTLRAASAALGMTQPGATKMLHELEDAVGYPLYDRVGRGLKLTLSGQCVLGYFRGMRGTLEALGRELLELRQGSAGKLLIGSIMAAAPSHLTHALIGLKAQFPLLSVEIFVGTSDYLVKLLQEGALDLVIGRAMGLPLRDYDFQPISDEALAVVAARNHALAGKKSVPFKALLRYPWILQPKGSPMRDVMEREFSLHNTPLPRGLIETASILTTTNLIAQSEMIAVIPDSVASRYQHHKLLSILPYRIQNSLSAYGSIVRRDRPPNMATARFLALLHGGALAQALPGAA
jgi:DNA-binding transcriptional LysR family regulator